MAMAPAWAQFESSYQKKAQIIYVNVDERNSSEFKSYSALAPRSIPTTLWLNAAGKVTQSHTGGQSLEELSQATDSALAAP